MWSCATDRPSACGAPPSRRRRAAAVSSRSLSLESRYFRFLGLPDARRRARPRADGRRWTSGAALVAESGGRIVAFAGFYRDAERRRSRRGRVCRLRRAAGARHRHAPAGAPRDHRARAGHRHVRRLRAGRQPAHARRVSRLRFRRRRRRSSAASVMSSLSLSVTEAFADKAAARSRTAATASMKAFFEPRVVAVVGANRERGKIGSEILHNLVAAGFTRHRRPRASDGRARSTGSRAYPRVDRHPRAGRSRRHRRPGRAGARGGRRLHREERPRDLRHQRRLRRMRRRRTRARSARSSSGSARRAAG